MAVELRSGQPEDLAGLQDIRNDAVRHSTALWRTDLITEAEGAEWLADLINRDALVVAHDPSAAGPDAVAGYGCYGPWRSKDGYRFTVENTVYLRPAYQGRGLGRALMVEVIARARASGAHVMMAAIESGNHGSIRLHEALGFENVGTIAEVGYKFDRWLDLTHLRLALD